MNKPQPPDENRDALELLRMVAPERWGEMQVLLKQYELSFCAGADKIGFVLQANPIGFVHFTNRTILHIWLLAWVMWKETYCWSTFIHLFIPRSRAFILSEFEQIPDQTESYAEADSLHSGALAFLRTDPMNWELWPSLIPRPRDVNLSGKEDRLIKDLVHHAIAFFLLHELRHLIIHRDGCVFACPLEEEFECDRWATQYLIAESDVYAQSNCEDSVKVKSKRAMGVALGAVVIAHVQTLGLWEAGREHPPISERMKRLIEHLDLPEDDFLWNVASSFLLASLRRQNALPLRVAAKNGRDLFRNLLSQQSIEQSPLQG